MFRARCVPRAPTPTARYCARVAAPRTALPTNPPSRPCPSASTPVPRLRPLHAFPALSRALATTPGKGGRRVFQVAGIPDPRVVERSVDLSKVSQEVKVYYSTYEKKYIRYFLTGACVQMVFTSIGAHMLYSSWELQKGGPEFLQRLSETGVNMLCAGFVFLGLACLGLVRHNARRRVTSMTLLPGGKRLRITVFTMLGTVSKPIEFDLADIERGRWVAHRDTKDPPGFFVRGKRVGYSLDPGGEVPSLSLLKTIIKHPSNLGDE